MTVYSLDPLRDPRWSDFVGRHPNASVFHTAGWLRALHRTYQYQPVAFTTSGPTEELRNALLFCAVQSWVTGRRLVSLPFTDHCAPLAESEGDLVALHLFIQRICKEQDWKYVEIRWASLGLHVEEGFQAAKTFYMHRLDLRPGLDALLASFHKNGVQQTIRRAEREGLTYEAGRSVSLVTKLYGLLQLTRRRQGLPPQPLEWFRNILSCLNEDVCVRIASKNGQPVAGILTLSGKKSMVYKYGASDARLNNLGGMPLLLWKAIQEAKQRGAEELDLGRSACDNAGLITFKERWAADRSTLTYWRYPAVAQPSSCDGWGTRVAKKIFARLPNRMLTMAGKLLYRHVA